MQTADIIEWQADTALGHSIRWFTKQNVNHTSGVAVMNLYGDPEKRMYIYEAVGNGVHPMFLSEALRNHKGKAFWLSLKSEYNSYRNEIAKAILEYKVKKYDYKSLIGSAFKRQKLDRTEVYCSELINLALVDVGLLNEDFNNGCGLFPGEFEITGLYNPPKRIL